MIVILKPKWVQITMSRQEEVSEKLLKSIKKSSLYNRRNSPQKLLELKFKKSTYFNDNKYSGLAKYFILCYEILCRENLIKLPERIEELNKKKWYDEDVITILCILQNMYKASWKNLRNRELILLWWLLFDNEVYKEKKRRTEEKRKCFKKKKSKWRTPSEYDNFFKNKDDKYLAKNSFQKYKNKLDIFLFKNYFETILDVCSNLKPSTQGMFVSQFFNGWFEFYVNNLELKNLKKIDNVPDNYDVILHLLKEISVNVIPWKCNNSRVLNFIFMNYRDVFIKNFF